MDEIPIGRRMQRRMFDRETRGLVRISNIPVDVLEEDLKEHFSQFGRVTNVKLCRTNISGNSGGYGFVEFDTNEMAKMACESSEDNTEICIASYVPEEERPPFIFDSVQNKITHGKYGKEVVPNYRRVNRIAGRMGPYTRNHLQKKRRYLKALAALSYSLPNLTHLLDF